MGGTVYDYGNESQFGVVYKKENLKELSEKDVAPPTLYPSRKEEFLNSLKVDITNKEQDPFPSDEDISKKWILVISFIVLTWMILIKR